MTDVDRQLANHARQLDRHVAHLREELTIKREMAAVLLASAETLHELPHERTAPLRGAMDRMISVLEEERDHLSELVAKLRARIGPVVS